MTHGPLVAVGVDGYDVGPLLQAVPDGVQVSHALLRAPLPVALQRVQADVHRPEGALSRDEGWLTGAHERFEAALAGAPAFRWDIDTVTVPASRIAETLATDLVAAMDP